MTLIAKAGDAATRVLRNMEAETAHRATVRILSLAAPLMGRAESDDESLGSDVLGLHFPNPIGLAAGFDKNAEAYSALLKLGFGFVECGTVTPRPQGGNPRPRLFRLPSDRAVINRMGFNNDGMARVAERLRFSANGVMGINIGANKDSEDRIADYASAYKRLAPLASYCAVNISSPNTPGLRGLQNRAELETLLRTVTEARRAIGLKKPLLLKIAPDLDDAALDDIADVSLASGIDGLIVSNTTLARPDSLKSGSKLEAGGLSGAPLFGPSTEILRKVRARVGSKLVLVGAGGVSNGAQAYEKIRAGASLVQLYSALVFQGPGLVARIKAELKTCLARDGFAHVQDAVGTA